MVLAGASLAVGCLMRSHPPPAAPVLPPPTATMPAPNPWLTDSVYPTSHFNPAATDSVPFAGLVQGKQLMRDKDVKVVWNLMASNPTVKKIGSDTVVFASGTLGIRKILATGKAFERLMFTPYPGFEDQARQADETAVAAVLADVDAARRAKDDAKLLAAIAGLERLGVTRAAGDQRRLQPVRQGRLPLLRLRRHQGPEDDRRQPRPRRPCASSRRSTSRRRCRGRPPRRCRASSASP